MTRSSKEHTVRFMRVTEAAKWAGYGAPSEALVAAIAAVADVHGQITSFNHNADQILHVRFEDGAGVDIAAQIPDARPVREFLVRATRTVN